MYKVKQLLLIVVFFFTAIVLKAQNENSPLGVNLGGIEAWSSEWVYVNIANQSYGWFDIGTQPAWAKNFADNTLTSDRYLNTGEDGILCIVWATSVPIEGDFVLTYTGDYTAKIVYSAKITEILNQAGRMEVTASGANTINVEFTANSGVAQISDIRFTKADEESLSQTFNPIFIADIEIFKVLRFMDFIETNHSEVVTISEYTTANSLIQRPISIAKLVELSNTIGANPWITTPMLADDALIASWAKVVGDNLNSDLTAKIELSNEVWNGQFPHDDSAAVKAQELGLDGVTGETHVDAPIYYGHRSAQIHNIFESEFSTSTNKPGLCKVVAWQAANSWFLKNYVLPAYVTEAKVQGYNGNDTVPDAVAIAPYFAGEIGLREHEELVETWTNSQLFEEILHGTYLLKTESHIDQSIAWTSAYRTVLDAYNINDLICYEAGPHLAGVMGVENNKTITTLFTEANRSPLMKEAYTEYLYRLDTAGSGVVCLFTSHGRFSKWGSWGLKEIVGNDASTSPKYQSAVDYINNSTATWLDGACDYTIVTHPNLRADFSTTSQLVCIDGSLTFTDKSITESTISAWEWNFGDGSGTSPLQNPTHIYTTEGKFAVTLTVTDGGGTNAITKTDWVTVYPNGNFITMQPTDELVTEGRSVTFKVKESSIDPTFQWYFNNAIITGATNTDYAIGTTTSGDAGTYHCEVNGCGSEVSDNATLTLKALNPSSLYESEDAILTAGITKELTYVSGTWEDTITYILIGKEAGNYPLKVRYKGSKNNQEHYITVNGAEDQAQKFKLSDEWTDVEYGSIALHGGTDTIQFFIGWSDNNATLFDNIYLEDKIIIPTYTIDTTATNGSIQITPSGTVHEEGTVVTLVPVPDAGFEFIGWSGDISGIDQSVDITMDADKTLVATFALIPDGRYEAEQANLTVVTEVALYPGYTGSGHTEISFPSNSIITFTVNVPTAGNYPLTIRYLNGGNKSQIVKVNEGALTIGSSDGKVLFPNSSNSWAYLDCGSITLHAGINSIELTPSNHWTSFDNIIIDMDRYTLDIASNNGTVTKSPNYVDYFEGESVELTANPIDGYKFGSWSDDIASKNNPLTISMDSNITITANFFVPSRYTLDITAEHGSVVKKREQVDYLYTSIVELTAMPVDGYQFSGWSGDFTGYANPTTIAMDTNLSITATFIPNHEVKYRYLRFVPKEQGFKVAEISWIEGGNNYPSVDLTSNNTPAPYVTYSSDDKIFWDVEWKLFDGKDDVIYFASVYTDITIDLGESTAIYPNEFYLKTRSNYNFNFNLEGSVHGAIWNVLLTQNQSGTDESTFVIPTPPTPYTLTVNSGSGSGDYAETTVVDIVAADPIAGEMFDAWTGDVGNITDINAPITTIAMPGSAASITATYKTIPVGHYKLTVNGGSGSGVITEGAEQTIVATIPVGEEFVKWAGADASEIDDSTSATAKITMPANALTVTAIYKDILYTLTVTDGEGSGNYAYYARRTIIATIPTGKEFVKWTGANASEIDDINSATTKITMPANTLAVVATFKDVYYSLTVTGGTGGGNYIYKAKQEIDASVAPAYKEFDAWLGADGFINDASLPTAEITMPASALTVVSTYKDILYALTVTGGSGSGSLAKNTKQTIVAGTAPIGQEFDVWTGGGTDINDASLSTAEITMPANALTVTATFKTIGATTYTLTVKNGTGGKELEAGANQTIIATIPTGKEFVKWTGANVSEIDDSTSATAEITMPASALTVTATFTDALYSLTVTGGTGDGNYIYNAKQTIVASVPIGKEFVKWIGATASEIDDSTSTTAEITMPDSALTVTATFTDALYSLTVTGGTGDGNYIYNAKQKIIASVPIGKKFVKWIGATASEIDDSTSATAEITMPANALTVTATFTDALYSLTVIGGTGDGSYAVGVKQEIIATIPEGKEFVAWAGATSSEIDDANLATAEITMPSNALTVVATFKDIVSSITDVQKHSISIYPNPTTQDKGIRVSLAGYNLANDVNVDVINKNGKVIYTKLHSYAKIINISTSKLSSGTYFIKVSSGDNINIKKLIVE